MRKLALAVVALLVCGCGKDDPVVVTIDSGPASDLGTTTDSGRDLGRDSGTGIPPDTVRDDLEVVVMDREVTFQGGESERLAFTVPDDAVSVTISVTGEKGKMYTLAEWTNGDGSDLVPRGWLDTDAGAPSLCLSCANRVFASESSFAAIAPNNEAVSLEPGTHNITAFGFSTVGVIVNEIRDGTATVRVIVKRAPQPPDTGVLDINFYLTGARGWTSETAPTDEALQTIIAEVAELYAQVDIELGVITYTDIPEEYSIIESVAFGPELQELFELSAGQPRNALNVFLVDEMFLGSGPAFGALLGSSGGIPGPPIAGTPRSGVAINTKGDPAFDVPTSRVIAHEVGHHLGLFHTTESEMGGGFHDPIADTAPDDPMLLMYHVSQGDILSATQGRVMRSNTWVHHEERP